MYKNIIVRLESQICILILNRPDKLNALNNETLEEIKTAFNEIYKDKSILAVIITGAGEKAFIAGADIPEIAELNELNGRQFSEKGQEIFQLIESCPKPVIAAINGYSLGGGCELALACHIRVASRNARFGLPEVSLGILPGYGGTQRLTQIIGRGRALEMILTGEMISADIAFQFGLINKLCETTDQLIPLALELAQKMVKNAPLALELAIEATNAAENKLVNGYQTEANCFSRALKTKDFAEGTQAFLEKRKPIFKGE